MQMTADYPGRPDFYDHRAKPDPEPGTRLTVPARKTLTAVVAATHRVLGKFSAELDELACRAENCIRDQEGRRMEGRDLAEALAITVQRLDLCLRGHARVRKEYGLSQRKETSGHGARMRVVFYFVA